METRIPEFLVQRENRWRNWWQGVFLLLGRTPPFAAALDTAPAFSALRPELAVLPSSRANLGSLLLHVSAVALLLHFPLLPFQRPTQLSQPEIVYDLKPVNLSSYLPNLRAPGPGGQPGRGTRPDLPPARGSTAFHPKLTILSNPIRPDNDRQTIIQPSSPPELRIKTEIPLPNIVVPLPAAVPKPSAEMRLDAKVRGPRVQASDRVAAPDVQARPSELSIAPSPVVNPLARLAVAPSLSGVPMGDTNDVGVAGPALPSNNSEGIPGGLLALSVNPGPLTSSLALPPGNRFGAFSISPAGGQPGSPGGVPGGYPGGGTGGPGMGGDGSTGIGPGGGGGGGQGIASPFAGVSISGGAGTGAGFGGAPPNPGALSASIPSGSIYPVQRDTPQGRKNALKVTTGPIGGGGLRVYGVLRGGKIYTVFVPMPGKNWVLQYCQASKTAASATRRRGVIAHLDYGVMPPVVEEKFDFLRPPVPKDKAKELIVLHGWLEEDGTLRKVEVYQGVEPLADQMALAAFRRWKFLPAMRDNKPIAVEFLVGVPALVETEPPDTIRAEASGS